MPPDGRRIMKCAMCFLVFIGCSCCFTDDLDCLTARQGDFLCVVIKSFFPSGRETGEPRRIICVNMPIIENAGLFMNIKDVAQRAGVSISTVSNVLNGRRNVSPEKAQAVMRAAEELNYIPNVNAQMMKRHGTGNIGLFLSHVEGPYYAALMPALFYFCAKAGYALLIYVNDFHTSRDVAQAVLSCNIDGAIMLNGLITEEDIRLVNQRGIPMVFMDRNIRMPGTGCVLIDNGSGTHEQVEYLYHTGHRRIAYMIGYENNDGNGREAAFRKAMEEFGLPLEPELMMQGLFNEKVAYNNVRVLIGRQERLPDAIVCASDEMAIGCMNAIHDMGMEVPGDVSVLGFDNLAIGEMCEPKLTTVDYDISRFCRMAVEELLRLIVDPTQEGSIQYTATRLIIRNSVALRLGRLK